MFARLRPQARQFVRLNSSKRLRPDPHKVPRTEPINLRDEAFRKTDTLDDFAVYDVVTPPNNVDFLLPNGFALSNGARVLSEDKFNGLILLGHEAFEMEMNDNVTGLEGRVEFSPKLLQVFDIIYPKPDMVVIGLGKDSRILGPKTQDFFRSRGIRTEAGNTNHGASHFDMLVSERGRIISAILLPPNM